MGRISWVTSFIKAGLIALATLVMMCPAARADLDQRMATVYVVGSSSIRGGDTSAGRDDAVQDSLVAAVTQVLGELMPPETLAGQFQVLSESILAHTGQFITDYQMLTETSHAGTHRVLVKANVSAQRLKAALKRAGIYIGHRVPLPLILFCVAERRLNEPEYRTWWSGQAYARAGAAAEIMGRIAQDKDFDLVVPRMDRAATGYPPELSIPEALALAQKQQAEVVVTGQAVVEEVPGGAAVGQKSYRAVVSVRAYSVKSGREISKAMQDAVVTGDDPNSSGLQAIENAARSAGNALAARIAAAWYSQGMGKSKIEIQVTGISGHMAAFVQLRGAMGAISGVDDIQRKEMQSDTAVLVVDYQGNARGLTDALNQQRFDTFSLNIADPVDNLVRVQIVPR
jgi:hypothetical protein